MLLKELISEYVYAHGISFRTFAKQCGLSPAYLSMINQGKNPSTGKPPVVSYPKLSKIAAGMGLTMHQLIAMVDDMPIDISSDDSDDDKTNTDILYISKPRGDMKGDEIRKYLHELIDQLSDDDLELMKDLSLRMVKK